MSTLRDRLLILMAENPKITQSGLGKACNVKQPSVNDWLSGRTKRMRGEVLLKAAAYLNVDDNWLATGKGSRERKIETDNDLIKVLGVESKDLSWDLIQHIQLYVKATDAQKEDVSNHLKRSFEGISKESGKGNES